MSVKHEINGHILKLHCHLPQTLFTLTICDNGYLLAKHQQQLIFPMEKNQHLITIIKYDVLGEISFYMTLFMRLELVHVVVTLHEARIPKIINSLPVINSTL